ncbi:aluminum activated malate transporter family protein [Novosphingobium mangrovi (ex Huang et al. 2023)]|uniref:Aluminum activated malate transporter family protein n=1 Tax=Novosphingobium mangrovi (ex Huang et al. 2023) TaxID=2976432 RepID=A0ABT2I4B1_9SPHN|nr:aluminum activated malate transporter family protein [Novosphingobium mangrovi (ex Huang et al. 2023)]MCT2399653.1 aluminum activated malate transporter family protein [Novosphingobium mangrovi (ex Huang et al. 2023)]
MNRIGYELRAMATPGPRMADTAACVISVLLAIVLAQFAGARMVSWAAVSALVLLKSDALETLTRGVMRMIGTAAGATLALVAVPLAVHSMIVASLSAAVIGALGLYGMLTGRRAYAWLLFGLTFEIVLFDKLSYPHIDTIELARTRFVEVAAGTIACVAVSLGAALLSGSGWLANRKQRPDRMRWNAQAARHAAQAGLALALLPPVYDLTRLPELSGAAITIIAVMIVPVAGLGRSGLVPVSRRLLHRAIGCIAGGMLAISVLLLADGSPAVIIAGTVVGLVIGRHLETGGSATNYVGLQFSIALLMALVPDTYGEMDPGLAVDRLIGIMVGMALMEPVLLTWHFIAARLPHRGGPDRPAATT